MDVITWLYIHAKLPEIVFAIFIEFEVRELSRRIIHVKVNKNAYNLIFLTFLRMRAWKKRFIRSFGKFPVRGLGQSWRVPPKIKKMFATSRFGANGVVCSRGCCGKIGNVRWDTVFNGWERFGPSKKSYLHKQHGVRRFATYCSVISVIAAKILLHLLKTILWRFIVRTINSEPRK